MTRSSYSARNGCWPQTRIFERVSEEMELRALCGGRECATTPVQRAAAAGSVSARLQRGQCWDIDSEFPWPQQNTGKKEKK